MNQAIVAALNESFNLFRISLGEAFRRSSMIFHNVRKWFVYLLIKYRRNHILFKINVA